MRPNIQKIVLKAISPALILGLILGLSGCSLLSEPCDTIKKYTLGHVAFFKHKPVRMAPSPKHIVVEVPLMYPPIDNSRLALKPEQRTIDYFADAEWGDRLALLIQESVIYSLQNSKYFRSVSRPGEGLITDYSLKLDVRGFHVNYASDMNIKNAEAHYIVQLIRNPTRRAIASKEIRVLIPMTQESLDAISGALNQAHLQAVEQMVEWAARHAG